LLVKALVYRRLGIGEFGSGSNFFFVCEFFIGDRPDFDDLI